MNSLGIALKSFGSNQLSYLFSKNANTFLNKNPEKSIIGFHEIQLRCPFEKNFSTMDIVEMMSFNGPIIFTNVNLVEMSLSIPCYKRIFYCYDLEWRGGDYKRMRNIYQNKNIDIVCPNMDYREIFEDVWQRPVSVIENCDVSKFYGTYCN